MKARLRARSPIVIFLSFILTTFFIFYILSKPVLNSHKDLGIIIVKIEPTGSLSEISIFALSISAIVFDKERPIP